MHDASFASLEDAFELHECVQHEVDVLCWIGLNNVVLISVCSRDGCKIRGISILFISI